MNQQLEIRLLGGVSFRLGGKPLTGLPSRRAEALLVYLVCQRRPFAREVLADLFWDDRAQEQALANLRSLLSSLRRKLKPYLAITRQTVAFDHESDYWLDTAEFMRLLEIGDWQSPILRHAQSLRRVHRGDRFSNLQSLIPNLQQATDLYRGDFLSGFHIRESRGFEEWVSLERERLRRLATTALRQLVAHHVDSGQYAAGMPYATRLLELNPLNEVAHRQMMLMLARTGQRAAALAQFESCRRLLAEELDVTPMAETAALYERIKTADPGRHNLPPQTTPFVGRQAELATINRRLARPDCRLLTLVGPGGIGKTRLALQAAADNVGRFFNGVYHVPLAPVRSAAFLVATIAGSLGITFSGSAEPEAELLDYLRQKEMLLALDNFEHLLDGADLLAEVIQSAPYVKLLVTSRERLNLRGEWLLGVEGLAYPQSTARDTAVAPEAYNAVQLFIQTARRIQPDFALAEADHPFVNRICQLLQGAPLGIELAAAWIRLFSCRQIAGEIEADLDFLATSLRDVPDRHQSLRAVFDHSWQLLTEPERAMVRKLSVFQGPFGREAAQEVAGATSRILISLVDKSFLDQHETGQFDMHQLLQQYTAEKLAATPDEQETTRTQHCRYYAGFLHQREQAIMGSQQKEALDEIGVAIENVRAGWEWAVARGKHREINQSLASLFRFYELRGWLREGEAAFGRAAAGLAATAAPGASPKERRLVHTQILARRGRLCIHLGQYTKARQLLETALAMSQMLDARQEATQCLGYLGIIAHMRGDLAQARRLGKEGLSISRRLDHQEGVAYCLNLLGNIAYRQGEYDQARRRLEESLTRRRESGDLFNTAVVLNNLGNIAQAQEAYADARRQYEESRAIFKEINHRPGMAAALTNAGYMAWKLGEYSEAKRLNQESLDIKRELGDRRGIAVSLTNLGEVTCSLGEYQESRRSFHEALRLAVEIKALPLTLEILVGIATLLVKEGEPERAVELLALAQRHPASTQETRDKAAQLLAALTTEETAERVVAISANEEARTLETAVTNILGNG